ncbi:MAG TPA: hypothetical protein VJ933_10370 [Phaeodactylibacter sp.]|nr:hypothetical protein [Phaeodactylibacter sp.]
MKNLVLLLFMASFLCFSQAAKAQEYNSAIGARLGSPFSASYKNFISEQGAIELFGNFRTRGVLTSYRWTRLGVGGAYQHHFDLEIEELEGLKWYVGGGATAYFWTYSNDGFFDDSDNLTFGVQGYVGLDYAFEDAPVNLSLDWVPTILLGNGYVSGFGAGYGALSIRYILN